MSDCENADVTAQYITKPVFNTGINENDEKGFFDYLTERTGIMQEVYESRDLMRDIQAGLDNNAMKSKYIQKMAKEPDCNYQNRLSDSVFYNITNRMIKINYNRPFGKPAQISSDDEYIQSLQDNFDGFNNSVTDFGKKWFKKALYDSQAHVFVDISSEVDINGKPIFNMNKTPKAFILDNDRILGARVNSYGEVIHLRFASSEDAPHPENPFDVQCINKVYVFDKVDGKVYYNVFTQVGEKEYESLFDFDFAATGRFSDTTYPIDIIPIVQFYPEDTDNYFYPDIIFKDLALKNIEFFRSSSDQTNILHVARVPILFFKGLPENHNGIAIGASAAVVADDQAENADGKFIEINGNSINAGRTYGNDLITQMESLGLELMSKKNTTATQSSIDNAQNLSLLTAFALKLQDKLVEVVKLMNMLKKAAGYTFRTEEFTLQIDTKFSVVVEQQELQFMQFLRSSGDISGKTITDYAKRLGYLPSNYSYTDDMENVLGMGTMAVDMNVDNTDQVNNLDPDAI